MAIANDWDINFTGKIISHIDGVLSYDTNTGTAPSAGNYIRGTTSGAVAKILTGSDLGGTSATGTLTLTNTVGQFVNNDPLDVLDSLAFDQVTASNGGFKVGDTLDEAGAGTANFLVRAIEYNLLAAGDGTVYGTAGGGQSWTDADVMDINGGQTNVAVADSAEVAGATFTGALANGTLAIPGTANTNDSVIIHYDAGTIAIPEGARIAETGAGAVGIAQQVYGVTATGSIRIVDSNSVTNDWSDNVSLEITQVVFYDNQVAGQVFSVGDVVVGATSGATGRVLAVIDDGDSTGKIILADQDIDPTDWDFGTSEPIQVGGVTIALVEVGTDVLAAATINIPAAAGGIRTEQRASQGGIYAATDSLNIVRSFNALYTYLQDTFDELGQLDDNDPMSAQVKDQAYTMINSWQIPDLSMRFLESGSLKDSANANIFANIQTLGTIADITNQGFLYDTTQKTPQPNLYVEQNGLVLRQDWVEGNINVLVKVKTKTDTRYIDPTVNTLGQLINSGVVTVFGREYLRTYDHFEFTNTTGGFVAVPLNTANDSDNATGQYVFAYDAGSAATLLVGEEFTATTAGVLKFGIVTAQTGDAGATGTVTYALKSGTQFADDDACTGKVSGKTFSVNEVGGFDSTNDVVAGYSTDIKIMTIDQKITGDGGAGTFIVGEVVTQSGSSATGFFMELDGFVMYIQKNNATAFTTGDLTITGATSGATLTDATAFVIDTNQLTVPKDIGDGGGDKNYKAVISGDITDADPQTIAKVYEWSKFRTRSESTSTEGGVGSASGINGQIYRTLDTTFAEKKASPYGTFAGGTMFGAQGVFIDKDTLIAADVQKISLIDNAGTTITPPNLQTLTVNALVSGDRVSVFRSTGVDSTTIEVGEFAVGSLNPNNRATDSTILLADGVRDGTPLPVDVPDSGVLRILDPNDTGLYLRFPYNAKNRTTNVFTLTTGTIEDVTGTGVYLTPADNAFVVLIEKEATATSVTNTIQYLADIPLLIRVRRKGILPFQTTGTFGSSGATIGAVRTSDTIVNLP